MAIYQARVQWTPLQRYWLPNYLQDAAGDKPRFSPRLITVSSKWKTDRAHRLAVETDVAPWEGPLPRGASIPLILSKDAARQDLHLVLEPAQKIQE